MANPANTSGSKLKAAASGSLARRCPIDRPGDTNAKATGGERQICDTLKPGEGGWILRASSVLKF